MAYASCVMRCPRRSCRATRCAARSPDGDAHRDRALELLRLEIPPREIGVALLPASLFLVAHPRDCRELPPSAPLLASDVFAFHALGLSFVRDARGERCRREPVDHHAPVALRGIRNRRRDVERDQRRRKYVLAFHFAPPVGFSANIATPKRREIAAVNGTVRGHANATATNSKNVSGSVGLSQLLQRATAKLATKKASRNTTMYTIRPITSRLLPYIFTNAIQ